MAKHTTHILYLLDESGSMGGLTDATISSFNEYLQDIKEGIEGKARLTLCKFNSVVTTVFENKQLKNVSELTRDDYWPRGVTALYDAIGEGVNKVKDAMKDDDRAICVIHTDGFENSSKEMTLETVKELISTLEAKENWSFVYFGSHASTWSSASSLGIAKGKVAMFNATEAGSTGRARAMSAVTTAYSGLRGQMISSPTLLADAGVELDEKGYVADDSSQDKKK